MFLRYFFHISYNGASYRGWQRQPNATSVQATLEKHLSALLKTPCAILGCGRTDALVHASQYVFHVDLDIIPDKTFLWTLNKMLPADIVIHEIIPVEPKNHAQHSAQWRTYDYFIHTTKNPFISQFSAYYPLENFDFDEMYQALYFLLNHDDFRALCLTPDRHTNTICDVVSVKMFRNTEGDRLRFQFTADRFLRGMIRILVGHLLEIGNGKISLAEFKKVLTSRKTPQLLHQAYPQGLYLSKVTYPFLDIPAKNNHFLTFLEAIPNYWIPFYSNN